MPLLSQVVSYCWSKTGITIRFFCGTGETFTPPHHDERPLYRRRENNFFYYRRGLKPYNGCIYKMISIQITYVKMFNLIAFKCFWSCFNYFLVASSIALCTLENGREFSIEGNLVFSFITLSTRSIKWFHHRR